MPNDQDYRVDIRVDNYACGICHKENRSTCFYHGDMIIEPVKINGYRVFRLQSEPRATTHWRFDSNFHDELLECAKAEAELAGMIQKAAPHQIKLTIVGPCSTPPTKGAYAFYLGEEFAWPPKKNRDGIVVWVDPADVHAAFAKKPQIPQPPKVEIRPPGSSEPTGRGGQVEAKKPNPLPSALSVPPDL